MGRELNITSQECRNKTKKATWSLDAKTGLVPGLVSGIQDFTLSVSPAEKGIGMSWSRSNVTWTPMLEMQLGREGLSERALNDKSTNAEHKALPGARARGSARGTAVDRQEAYVGRVYLVFEAAASRRRSQR